VSHEAYHFILWRLNDRVEPLSPAEATFDERVSRTGSYRESSFHVGGGVDLAGLSACSQASPPAGGDQ
jgi:hypothetical protein